MTKIILRAEQNRKKNKNKIQDAQTSTCHSIKIINIYTLKF